MDRKFLAPEKKKLLMKAMRTNWSSLLILVAIGLTNASAEPSKYQEMHKSLPVVMNGLKFVATTQTQWICRKGTLWPVEIQLLITNRTDHDLVFRTFDTFALQLKDANGKEIPLEGGRNGTSATLSVLLHAGDTYCLSRLAKLWWKASSGPAAIDVPDGRGGSFKLKTAPPDPTFDYFGWKPDGKSCALFYWDGTGFVSFYRLPSAGSYSLSFSVRTNDKEAVTESKKLGGLPVWSGTIRTGEAPFEIIEESN